MKHARSDYARIQDPAGKIPAGEPVFLIRGQDPHAAQTLRFHADQIETSGGDAKIVEAVRRQADAMEAWPVKKRSDMPVDASITV